MNKIKRIIFCCIFSFVIVMVISVYSFVKLDIVRKENAMAEQTISLMQSKETKLKKDIENMKTDDYLDDQAREQLNMIKDGETLYDYD